MFHGMVQRALRVQSGVVVMIDSELILLPHVSVVLRSLHAVDHDWLLTGLPRTVDDFPYSLRDDWLQAHGVQIEDEKVCLFLLNTIFGLSAAYVSFFFSRTFTSFLIHLAFTYCRILLVCLPVPFLKYAHLAPSS